MSTTKQNVPFEAERRARSVLNFTRDTCLREESRRQLDRAIETRWVSGLSTRDSGAAVRHFARFVELCERIQAADADAEFGEL